MIHKDAPHFLRFGLVAIFLIAILAIVGIVGLTTSGGVQFVQADNLAGQASQDPRAITYEGYDADTHSLVFSLPPYKARVSTLLDEAGDGILQLNGRSYPVELFDTGNIQVDTNADGYHDTFVDVNGKFVLKQR